MSTRAVDTVRQDQKRVRRFVRQKPEVRRRQLIEATIRCLGAGGMTAFTIDRICQEAQVSRGLTNHYFRSKDDLLVAAYEAMTDYLAEASRAAGPGQDATPMEHLTALVEVSFDREAFDRSKMKAWLTFWGELSTNDRLQAVHRKRYRTYRAGLTAAIAAIAQERGCQVDAAGLALTLISLIDGLWLEWCIDPTALSATEAKSACYALLERALGPVEP